ncbi:hypothetical protein ACFYZE_25740 [Streptomyces sp. NPDC001796]|uniref:hypothetical protein n=1 Tax=Streptomyces sp. NPDC001796 TaxID=3364609 RepID=UPI003680DEC3
MVTFHQLMELDANALETFADRWNAIHRKIEEARTEFHDGVVQKLHQDHWQGEAGQRAQVFCDRVQMDIDALDKEVRGLRDFIDTEVDGVKGTGGSKGLQALQRQAREIQQEALEQGMTVSADGRIEFCVIDDPADPEVHENYEKHQNTADRLQERLNQVLGQASEEDEWLAKSLKVVFGTAHNFESENRKFDIEEPDAKDHKVRNQLNNVGAYFATVKGWPTAAGLIQHYLDCSGKTVEVEPQTMMDQIPAFQSDVDDTLRKDVHGRPDGPFTTEWKSTAPNPADGDSSTEWYYALNHFQYRLTGYVHDGEVTYRVEVKKRYDWGIPSEHRANATGGWGPASMNLEQADIAHLNTVGMGRDFDVVGTSDEMTSCA